MVSAVYAKFRKSYNFRILFFLDSLNRIGNTSGNKAYDTAYILKTINSGDNWQIKYIESGQLEAIWLELQFINQNTGFV